MKRRKDPGIAKVEILSRARARLEKERIETPPEPDVEQTEVPEELADLSDADLMEELREKTAWVNHLSVKLAEAEAMEEAAEYYVKRTRTKIMLADEDRYGTVTELKMHAESSEEFLEAEDEFRTARTYRKMLQPIYESAERRASNISREITRRVGRDGPDRRSSRWSP
jgi:L-lactate utilization protein LutC